MVARWQINLLKCSIVQVSFVHGDPWTIMHIYIYIQKYILYIYTHIHTYNLYIYICVCVCVCQCVCVSILNKSVLKSNTHRSQTLNCLNMVIQKLKSLLHFTQCSKNKKQVVGHWFADDLHDWNFLIL